MSAKPASRGVAPDASSALRPAESPQPLRLSLPPSPQSLAHLAGFAACALYLCIAYPSGIGYLLPLFIAGIACEVMPIPWKRAHLSDVVLLALVVLGWAVAPPTGSALHGCIGLILAWAFLVPARAGWLALAVLLPLAELLMLGRDVPSESLGGRTDPALTRTALVLIPLAALLLGLGAYADAGRGARGQQRVPLRLRTLAWLRGAAVPALVVALIGLGAGLPFSQPRPDLLRATGLGTQPKPDDRTLPKPPTQTQKQSNGPVRPPQLGQYNISPSDELVARLSWTDLDRGPSPGGLVYLRGLAIADLEVRNNDLVLRAPPTQALPVAFDAKPPPRAVLGSLVRYGTPDDLVLRLDGAPMVDLGGGGVLRVDREGNLHCPEFDRGPIGQRLQRTYSIGLTPTGEALDRERYAAWRALPSALEVLPFAEVEDPAWRTAAPEAAAASVAALLAARCTYALDHLPLPDDRPGGMIVPFLFGEPAERRGHCQMFSTSALLLLRRAGHATRLVVGFASDEFDGTMVRFRARHAHAWIEVVDSEGAWLRVDPTPGNPTLAPAAPATAPGRTPRPSSTGATRSASSAIAATGQDSALKTPLLPAWAWWGSAAVLLVAVGLWSRRRRGGPRLTRRAAELERRTHDLVALAVGCGIPVTASTTLAELVRRIMARAQLDLRTHLAAHHAARFAEGPLPPPWPIAELRSRLARGPNQRSGANE